MEKNENAYNNEAKEIAFVPSRRKYGRSCSEERTSSCSSLPFLLPFGGKVITCNFLGEKMETQRNNTPRADKPNRKRWEFHSK